MRSANRCSAILHAVEVGTTISPATFVAFPSHKCVAELREGYDMLVYIDGDLDSVDAVVDAVAAAGCAAGIEVVQKSG